MTIGEGMRVEGEGDQGQQVRKKQSEERSEHLILKRGERYVDMTFVFLLENY